MRSCKAIAICTSAMTMLGTVSISRVQAAGEFFTTCELFCGYGAEVGGTGNPAANQNLVSILNAEYALLAQEQAAANAAGLAEQKKFSPIIKCPATAGSNGISQLIECISNVK